MKQIAMKVKSSGFEGILIGIVGNKGNRMILVEFPTGVRDWFHENDLVPVEDPEKST